MRMFISKVKHAIDENFCNESYCAYLPSRRCSTAEIFRFCFFGEPPTEILAHSIISITLRCGPLYWFLFRNGEESRALDFVVGLFPPSPSATTSAVLEVVTVPLSVTRSVFARVIIGVESCLFRGGRDETLAARSAGTSKIEG